MELDIDKELANVNWHISCHNYSRSDVLLAKALRRLKRLRELEQQRYTLNVDLVRGDLSREDYEVQYPPVTREIRELLNLEASNDAR